MQGEKAEALCFFCQMWKSIKRFQFTNKPLLFFFLHDDVDTVITEEVVSSEHQIHKHFI